MKKILTEQQLMAIVSEATMRVLNEIGNTPAGRQAIKLAYEKSSDLGRRSQANNILMGLQRANRREYGDDNPNADGRYKYKNADGKLVILYADGTVIVNDPASSFNAASNRRFAEFLGNSALRTDSRATARKIVQWIKEYCDQEFLVTGRAASWEALTDWHYWAY